ncbi:MAG: NADH-quinone oxidoreductase subunit C [Enterobacterales bacterium]|nr:NADH-quinone oxidoreductase subunit C [Enterobacterales bacterium]
MANALSQLKQAIDQAFESLLVESHIANGELTLIVEVSNLTQLMKGLRDNDAFLFEQLMDVAGIDYLTYGLDEWATQEATSQGFERGRQAMPKSSWPKQRYAVVYHLLSVTLNHRVRVKTFVAEDSMLVPSLVNLWNGANWFEREAFDLFGLLFDGHPDLRRILTDYGFIGHPFRKDFPVIGELEMKYDEEKEQCVYQPVSIEERILVPRVIR